MHGALTGVRVLVIRTPEHAHWLAHFCWGLHIVTADKGKATEMSNSDVRSLVHFCRGFILWHQGTCFYVWLWYKKERTPKHSAIWLILGGYAPSYKSDSLVFRCSFYYLYTAILRGGKQQVIVFKSFNRRDFKLCTQKTVVFGWIKTGST
jgi:hypothetical protein